MNIDHITPSTLHVTAKENLHIEDDLTKESTKTIAELLDDKEKEIEQTEPEQKG